MHSASLRLCSAIALFTCAPCAFAQGSDLCASAQPISGTGTFAFDLTTATTDGAPDAACNFFGQTQIEKDVWFSWLATATGLVTMSTCGLTSVDTKMAVYDGSCAGVVRACNDDSCGVQSLVTFHATAGNTYVIRLGTYPGAAAGTGSFDVSIDVPVLLAVLDTRVNPANGHTYALLAGGSWTSAEFTAQSLGGHLATVNDQAEHDWISAQYHTWQGVDTDLWIGLNDETNEGTFVWADGTPVTYTNWDSGEPSNANYNEDYADMRKNNPLALWNDLPNAPVGFHANPSGVVEISAPPAVVVCSGDGSGTACPCANNSTVGNDEGCINSLGSGGKLRAVGSASISFDSFVLQGTQMPSAPCLYFQGTNAINSGSGVTFGDGLRCAGGGVIRLGTKTNSAGASQYPVGADPTVSVRGMCTVGASRVYQVWYRNAAAFCTVSTFNLTNGLQVTWAN